MKVTLFTPTHRPRHLERLARSVHEQTCRDFEWLVVPNGDALAEELPLGDSPHMRPPIRFVPYTGVSGNIGAIKRFCCEQARGEYLVEVDHDDELTPDCVAEVIAAFEGPSRPDFVYSNCCEISDGKPWTYSEEYGWEYRPFRWRDAELKEMVAFDPSPASFSRVWYAPNHVRAWRGDFYRRIGGHDTRRAVLDDHDLVARSYIHGRVEKIDKCLYIYHLHEGNTCRGEQNAFIQRETLALHDKHIQPLVEKWLRLTGLRRVDLTADLPRLLEAARWPYDDEEVGLFLAADALCKLPAPQRTMEEIHRCLAPGGWLLSQTPSTDGRGAYQDPRHVSFWNLNSFWYYTRRRHAGFIGTTARFQAVRLEDFFPSDWHEENRMPYVQAHLLKPAGRVPGYHEFRDEAPRETAKPARRRADYRFTLLTPTIGRESLVRCCRSVDEQTYPHWQHIVVFDAEDAAELPEELRRENRLVLASGGRNHDVGNRCRHLAYGSIEGDYVLHLDDDNYLLHPRVLEGLNRELRGEPWAVCPILRFGEYFFHDPPGRRRTDQAQLVYRPRVRGRPARFPDVPDYDADGQFCQWLLGLCPPRMLHEVGPIIAYDSAGGGE